MKIRIISAADIDRAITMAEAIEANARAFMAVSRGQARVPLRLHLETPGGVTLLKPGYLEDEGSLACKVITIFPQNPAQGIPTSQALLLVFDGATGTPLALMDGTRLTALRTGAASGAATALLARPDSKVLALFGAGGNCLDQAEAVLAVRPLQGVRIYDPRQELAQWAARRLAQGHRGLKVSAAANAGQAVQGADVICCATTSLTPVFDPAQVAPGAHINGTGSFRPDMREVQVKGLSPLKIFVDSLESALAEAGDLVQAMAEGLLAREDLTELGAALDGQAAGRISGEQITFFKSVGTAAQDVATARVILRNARDKGLGSEAEL